jgi:hypothetical protein
MHENDLREITLSGGSDFEQGFEGQTVVKNNIDSAQVV